ncbi:MAG TPA: oxidoreductase [Myxococcota bacterium]|nr:oxidoreductase [Myxococcota bacterium]
MPWTHADVPDQSGRTFVVTGANSGIGLEAAKTLAGAGAIVVLACRDARKAEEAAAEIRALHPRASLEFASLDLASLASVRDFAKAFSDRHARLDVLVNNAGVMAIPRRTTAEGFEMQLGTNHLGHFALTGLLLPLLLATPDSRVVTVSSTAHRAGRMRWDDLHGERSYQRWLHYGQSKLANLLFTYELDRRARAASLPLVAAACHPGYAATNLQFVGAQMDGSRLWEGIMKWANGVFSQPAEMGALPTLYASTAPDVRGGDYYGPDRMFETWGHPTKVASSPRSRDAESARRLWEVSEELTGVRYEGLAKS